jgi:hypothetical protein
LDFGQNDRARLRVRELLVAAQALPHVEAEQQVDRLDQARLRPNLCGQHRFQPRAHQRQHAIMLRLDRGRHVPVRIGGALER